jgi:anti-sigma regulatory factor (Ser/Thr protein kinase)
MKQERRMDLSADSDGARVAAESVRDLFNGSGSDAAFVCELAVAEAAANIVEHAIDDDTMRRFTLVLRLREGRFAAAVCDRGRPFSPAPDPALPAEGADSGRGLALLAACMERVRFRRVEDENRLLMARRVTGGPP